METLDILISLSLALLMSCFSPLVMVLPDKSALLLLLLLLFRHGSLPLLELLLTREGGGGGGGGTLVLLLPGPVSNKALPLPWRLGPLLTKFSWGKLLLSVDALRLSIEKLARRLCFSLLL